MKWWNNTHSQIYPLITIAETRYCIKVNTDIQDWTQTDKGGQIQTKSAKTYIIRSKRHTGTKVNSATTQCNNHMKPTELTHVLRHPCLFVALVETCISLIWLLLVQHVAGTQVKLIWWCFGWSTQQSGLFTPHRWGRGSKFYWGSFSIFGCPGFIELWRQLLTSL